MRKLDSHQDAQELPGGRDLADASLHDVFVRVRVDPRGQRFDLRGGVIRYCFFKTVITFFLY